MREEMAHNLESAGQEKHRLLEGNESYWRGQVKQLETRATSESLSTPAQLRPVATDRYPAISGLPLSELGSQEGRAQPAAQGD